MCVCVCVCVCVLPRGCACICSARLSTRSQGEILAPEREAGRRGLLLVPQRTYMVLGSLASQLAYPEAIAALTPEVLMDE